MTDTSSRSRHAAGQPVGGQFATEAKGTDTGVSLDGEHGDDLDEPRGALLNPAEYEATLAKVAKINARAAKRGFTGRLDVEAEPEVTVNEPNPATDRLPFPELPAGAEVVRYRTTITGEPPKYEGWEFLASLDALPTSDGETEWMVRCSPGVTDEQVDRSTLVAGACDHCNTTRHNRRKMMLVHNPETGEYKQVGASCIKDFLGWSAQPVFLDPADAFSRDSGEKPSPPTFTPQYTTAVALATVQAFGWTSRGAAGQGRPATTEMMSPYLYGPNTLSSDAYRRDMEIIDAIEENMESAKAKTDEVIDTLVTEFADSESGYEANLRAALRAEYIGPRQMGIAASAVSAYERIVGKRAERSAAAQRESQWEEWEPEYLGEVGEKVGFTGKVVTAMTVDGFSYNSTQRLVVIHTETGMAKFYSSAGWTYDIDSGDTVTVNATVKKHAEYKGKKQTVVKSPKIVGEPVREPGALDDDEGSA